MSDKDDILFRINTDISKSRDALSQAGRHFETFGQRANRSLAAVGRYTDAATKGLGLLGTAGTAIASGALLKKLFSVGEYMPIEKSMLRLQANLGASIEQVAGLKKGIAGIAQEHGDDIAEAMAKAADLAEYLKPDEITKVLSAGLGAAKAMGQELGPVVDRIAQMERLFGLGVDKSQEIVDILVASRLSAEGLDKILERGTLKGLTGENYKEALTLFGGLRRSGLDKDVRAVTGMIAVWNAAGENQAQLLHAGINPKGKNRVEILEQIAKTNARLVASGKLTQQQLNESMDRGFGKGAAVGINFLIAHLMELKKAEEDTQHAEELAAKRREIMAKSWTTQLGKVKAAVQSIKLDLEPLYDTAKVPVAWLGDHPAAAKGAALGLAGLSLAVLLALAGTKGAGFLKSIRNVPGAAAVGGTLAGTTEGMALQAATGVQPVFVTNWPGALGALGGGSLALGIAGLSPFIPLIVGAVAAYMLLQYMDKPEVKKESADRESEAEAVDARTRRVTGRLTGLGKHYGPVDLDTASMLDRILRPPDDILTPAMINRLHRDPQGQVHILLDINESRTRVHTEGKGVDVKYHGLMRGEQ